MMPATIAKPFTNLQFELLQLFQYSVSDQEVLDIKELISNYYAKRVMDNMDKLWVERNWSDKTMEEWLKDEKQ